MKVTLPIILAILTVTVMSTAFAQEESSSIFIYKSSSQSIIDWSDEIEIKITAFSLGSNQISDIKIRDTIPFGFKLISTNGITMEDGYLVFRVDDLQPEKEKEFLYKIKPVDGIKGEKPIDTTLPRAKVSYLVENIRYDKESNSLQVTVKESKQWWQENIAATVALLVIISFGFGTFGTMIHNQNLNFAKKKEQDSTKPKEISKTPVQPTNQPTTDEQQSGDSNKEKTTYPPLIGGVAGIIVLASFEGLSSLFANGQLQPTVQNMVVLIATSLAAGFTPVAVIDKMTSKFKTEAESAKDQKNAVEKLKDEIEKQNKEIEAKNEKIKAINTQLEKNAEERGINRDAVLKSNQQLLVENEDLKKQIFQLLSEKGGKKNEN